MAFTLHSSGTARPEVRGTAEPHGGSINHISSLSPVCPLVLPHNTHHYLATDWRAERDGLTLTEGTLIAHYFNAICGGGGGVCREPRTTTSFDLQRELPLARLVIHRETSGLCTT